MAIRGFGFRDYAHELPGPTKVGGRQLLRHELVGRHGESVCDAICIADG